MEGEPRGGALAAGTPEHPGQALGRRLLRNSGRNKGDWEAVSSLRSHDSHQTETQTLTVAGNF